MLSSLCHVLLHQGLLFIDKMYILQTHDYIEGSILLFLKGNVIIRNINYNYTGMVIYGYPSVRKEDHGHWHSLPAFWSDE
jgi:hypothetical protein